MFKIPDTSLDFPNVDLSKFPVLGSGLWGFVLDLEDGTVLKLAKRSCAGIGDGAQKILREATVLKAIHSVEQRSVVDVPELVAWGERKREVPSSFSDYPLWLRTTKATGTVKQVADLVTASTEETRTIAESISRSVIEIHDRLEGANLRTLVPDIQQNRETLLKGVSNNLAATAYIRELGRILETFADEPKKLIHGDFNISNLLFERQSVMSVVDFAETRIGFAEEDLAAIISEVPNVGTHLCENFERLSGVSISSKRLNFAIAYKDFFTFLISERLGQSKNSEAARIRLEKYLGEVQTR